MEELLNVLVVAARRKTQAHLEALGRVAGPVISHQLVPEDSVGQDALGHGLVGGQPNVIVHSNTGQAVLARVGALLGLCLWLHILVAPDREALVKVAKVAQQAVHQTTWHFGGGIHNCCTREDEI